MPGAGRNPWPACKQKAGGSYHRFSQSSGIPCATVLQLIRDLPGDRAFLPPSSRLRSSARLVASVGATGPHDFAVRVGIVRPHARGHTRRRRGHRIPAPRIVTIGRNVPLWSSAGWRGSCFRFMEMSSTILIIGTTELRQNGTTGNLRMVHMRDCSSRSWTNVTQCTHEGIVPSLREAFAPKQSSARGKILDCFAEPVIRPRFARTGWLAMTRADGCRSRLAR